MATKDYQPRPKTTWKEALKAENCVQVRKLLWEPDGELCPRAVELLKEGWEGVNNAKQSLKHNPAIVWKGRTALHVAARRGDVKLVKDILDAWFSLIPRASMAGKEQGGIGSTSARVQSKKRNKGIGSTNLNHLLEVIDDDYELDALGMAVVNGNKHVVNLLKRASLRCGWNPYDISHDAIEDREVSDEGDESGVLAKALLSKVTNEVMCEVSVSSKENDENARKLIELYKEDCYFNFIHTDADIELNMHLFLHFTFSTWTMPNEDMAVFIEDIQKQIISRASTQSDNLLEYLLVTLKDGQGRTALHIAVDSEKVGQFLQAINQLGKGDQTMKYLNQKDSVGRTPLYRAAARNLSLAVDDLLNDERTDVHAEIEYHAYEWGKGLDIDKLSWKNGFRSECVFIPEEKLIGKGFDNRSKTDPDITPVEKISSTALHVAIIHKHEDIVKQILKGISKWLSALLPNRHFKYCIPDCKEYHFDDFSPKCARRCTWPVVTASQVDEANYQRSEVTTMQLAVLVGSIPIVKQLLEAEEKWTKPDYFSGGERTSFPDFLLATAMGDPGLLKAFLDSKQKRFDYTVVDSSKNSALHHALKGKHVQFNPHMVDFVGCRHVYFSHWDDHVWKYQWLANPQETTQGRKDVGKYNKEDLEDRFSHRRVSINLLLEAGMDAWAENSDGMIASPDHDAPKDFVEWWHDKIATVRKEEQNKLTEAANAISVTAALVATASYVGPLQPPLGYNGDSMQVNILAVRIFIVFDSLSFYFALAAIMWALLPWLGRQRGSMAKELMQARILVVFAAISLYPSILCVLVAFAAGSIAVIPDHGLSHHGLTHGLIVATTVVGGLACLYQLFFLVESVRDRLKPILTGLYTFLGRPIQPQLR